VSTYNQDILKYYINDFGRVWIYRAQLNNGIWSRSLWFGSRYDKAGLAALSGEMANLYLRWLDEQCRLNGVFSGKMPAARR
jgi:hypothetical protein